MWKQKLLRELGVELVNPIKMFCDNQATKSITKNPVHYDRTKHIEIDQHFISKKIKKEIVHLVYITTKSQNVDILTKALPRTNFEELSHKLCMYNIYNPAWEGVLKSCSKLASNFRDFIRYFLYVLIRGIWYYMTRSQGLIFPSLVEDFFSLVWLFSDFMVCILQSFPIYYVVHFIPKYEKIRSIISQIFFSNLSHGLWLWSISLQLIASILGSFFSYLPLLCPFLL